MKLRRRKKECYKYHFVISDEICTRTILQCRFTHFSSYDHKLANNLLRHGRLFTLTEVLKAITMLDAARQIRVYEKQH
jgi:hypothetical protein